MFILDTNILSEMMKSEPDPNVEAWLAKQPTTSLFVTSVTQAELFYGVAILPAGKRRQKLQQAIEDLFKRDFSNRVLPFDSEAATAFSKIAAGRRTTGSPISQFDAQIAAIARSRGAKLATRNEADFAGCGIEVKNPWRK